MSKFDKGMESSEINKSDINFRKNYRVLKSKEHLKDVSRLKEIHKRCVIALGNLEKSFLNIDQKGVNRHGETYSNLMNEMIDLIQEIQKKRGTNNDTI